MPIYNCTGSIFIEGTMEQADYDFDMESESDPNEFEILSYMIEMGILQVLHENTELIDGEQ
jgi:hypothetical protein